MKKIVAFCDLYSFRGDYDHSAVIYNSDDKTLLHHSRIESIPGFMVEDGDNYVDRRESFTYSVITISEHVTNLHVALVNQTFDLNMFNQLGFAYQRVEYVVPDNAPIDEIKELLSKDNQVWQEIKNGLGKHLGYILPCITFKIVNADEFYLKTNPLYGEVNNESN